MKLLDLLEVVDEMAKVIITHNGEIIAEADGCDSIPVALNSAEVVGVYAGRFNLAVEVNPNKAWVITYRGHDYGLYYSKPDAHYQVLCMQKNDGLDVKLSDIRKATKEELERGILES